MTIQQRNPAAKGATRRACRLRQDAEISFARSRKLCQQFALERSPRTPVAPSDMRNTSIEGRRSGCIRVVGRTVSGDGPDSENRFPRGPRSMDELTDHRTEILQLANGISADEFEGVAATLGQLDERLRSFEAGTVELQLSVKEHDTPSQHTTLEAWISGHPRLRLVTTSSRTDLDAALVEVRDDMIRQITDAKNRTEPRNNRAGRERDERADGVT